MVKIISDITKIYPDNSMTVITYKTSFVVKDKTNHPNHPAPYSDAPRNLTQAQRKIAQFKADQAINRSLRRSKSRLRDLVLSNDFDLWVTLTLSPKKVESRYSTDLTSCVFQNEIKRLQKKFGKFFYIMVPELHKSGAYHYHGLLKGYNGQIIPAYERRKLSELKKEGAENIYPYIENGVQIRNDKGTLLYHNGVQIWKEGRPCYNMPDYQLGFSNVKIIDKTNQSLDKLSSYITKYITKYMPVLTQDKKRYWCSKELLSPIIKHNQKKQLTKGLKSTSFFDNEYQIIERFNDVFEDIYVKK